MKTTLRTGNTFVTFDNIGEMLKFFGTPIRELSLKRVGDHFYHLTRNGQFVGEVSQQVAATVAVAA